VETSVEPRTDYRVSDGAEIDVTDTGRSVEKDRAAATTWGSGTVSNRRLGLRRIELGRAGAGEDDLTVGGTMADLAFLGSRIFFAGLWTMRRSRTASLRIAKKIRKTVSTVSDSLRRLRAGPQQSSAGLSTMGSAVIERDRP
jgi:hypothetical protein